MNIFHETVQIWFYNKYRLSGFCASSLRQTFCIDQRGSALVARPLIQLYSGYNSRIMYSATWLGVSRDTIRACECRFNERLEERALPRLPLQFQRNREAWSSTDKPTVSNKMLAWRTDAIEPTGQFVAFDPLDH